MGQRIPGLRHRRSEANSNVMGLNGSMHHPDDMLRTLNQYCSINHYLTRCNIALSILNFQNTTLQTRHNLKTALIAFVKYACHFLPKTMGTSLDFAVGEEDITGNR
ncbi:hypothetical protein CEXT_514441 [Caerostris extrusa]|uniref:Uncharacterized protein n=1 Tax=Caerostris extrusa TaxID=172846 RepID=A0AAV4T7W0_CAEEX|nr:hypothetical protein CEXT_514441 [Caerostris extrusa]